MRKKITLFSGEKGRDSSRALEICIAKMKPQYTASNFGNSIHNFFQTTTFWPSWLEREN